MTARVLFARLLPLAAGGMLMFGASAAQAATSVTVCVPTTAGAAITSAGSGTTCSGGATPIAMPTSATAQQTLISILPYLNYVASGVGGKPTIQFTGANVQLINGSGSSTTANGEGNLVLGYNESAGTQTGSHNIVLGQAQTFTGTDDLIGGYKNNVSGNSDIVFGGYGGATGTYSDVLGGAGNNASATYSTISGGADNITDGTTTSIVGGANNITTNNGAGGVVVGGEYDAVTGYADALLGGCGNTTGGAANPYSSNASAFCTPATQGTTSMDTVSGGALNDSEGLMTSILGGDAITLTGNYTHTP